MSASEYIYHSANECDRLERQAELDGLERHLRHLTAASYERILDAGSGSGVLARLLAARYPGSAVVGVDLNSDYVAYACRRAAAEQLNNLSFEQGDLQALPFAGESFDVVWSRFVLYYLPRPEAAIREFRRVLRPGGALILTLHGRTFLLNSPEEPRLQEQLELVINKLTDMRLAEKAAPALSAAGFTDISVEVEMDRIYTAIGSIGAANRQNLVEIASSGMNRIADILGGPGKADAFLSNLLAYLDRPDTCTYSLLWTIKAGVPRL